MTAPATKAAVMDSLKLIQTLLREVANDLEPPATRTSKTAAVKKLNRIVAIASTLALTLEPKR